MKTKYLSPLELAANVLAISIMAFIAVGAAAYMLSGEVRYTEVAR